MANVARLGVVMGLDTAEFTSGIEYAQKTLENFKDRLLELGSAAAFTEMTKAALEYADNIVKTANANDVTTSSVLELSRALEESGSSAEATGQVYSGFSQKVESAALGSAKAQFAFAQLGVTLKDLQTLSSQDLFAKTISGLANIQDAVQRNGLAFQTLGKALRGADIVVLNENLKEVKGTMDQYAASIEQAHQLSLNLQKDSNDIGLEFTKAVIPALDLFYEGLHKLEDPVKKLIQLFGVFMDVLAVTFYTVEQGVIQLADLLKTVGITIADVLTGDISKAKKDWKDGLDEMGSDYAKYEDALQKIQAASETKKKSNDPANRPVQDALAKQLGAAQSLSAEYKKHADLSLQQAQQARELLGLTKDEQSVQVAINKVITDNQKAQDDIDKKIAQAKLVAGSGELIKTYEKQKQAIDDMRNDYIQKTQDMVQSTIDFQRTFEFGWESAYRQYAENATNYAKQAGDMFNSITNNMDKAISDFVDKGKINFTSLANSIIKDMIRIALQAQASQALSSLFGGIGSGYNSIVRSANQSSADFVGPVMSSAVGGPLGSGQASIVGENGPELFIPSRSGTIIPNTGNLSGALGGGGVTYNGPYIANMSAIDTQSALQFIAKNQNSIWAANQAAQRSLPQSR